MANDILKKANMYFIKHPNQSSLFISKLQQSQQLEDALLI